MPIIYINCHIIFGLYRGIMSFRRNFAMVERNGSIYFVSTSQQGPVIPIPHDLILLPQAF